ncbi:MAG: phosphate ABC transporter substrate-binding protein [Vicinamibacterales bacterium]|jgi:phosphate transport system substrate-binding protein|nr:phosphate ABC transporter substrate-binding protein [Vicinamibacterales bacterium]
MTPGLRRPAAVRRGLAAVLAAAALVPAGCRPRSGDVAIQNKGSDTMVNVAQAWAETYQTVAPGVNVEVSGGGSGTGIAALIKGTVHIANASRDVKAEEAEQVRRNTGLDPVDFKVGYDALAIYVHPANPLDAITFDQLAGIYREDGALVSWSHLGAAVPGCKSDEIVRVSRQSSSGTYEFFRERVLSNRDFKLGSRDLNGSKEVVELVSTTPCAIGYSGMGYATPRVKILKVARQAGATAYPPTVESTWNQSYPIARSLHMYTLGAPAGPVKAYLAWILSADGQRILEQSGYVPVSPKGGVREAR